MSRRRKYPEGSMLNGYDKHGVWHAPRRFNSALWSWRIYKLKTAAPALLLLLLLVACGLLAARGGA